MGYDLYANNKKTNSISIGAFSWPFILQETGAGYVLGYGEGRTPGSYIYQKRGNHGSPVSNDGYKVTSTEAKMMAQVMRGYISVQRFINKEWNELPEDQREIQKTAEFSPGKLTYKQGVHEDRLKQIEQIAEFLEKSKGFKIR